MKSLRYAALVLAVAAVAACAPAQADAEPAAPVAAAGQPSSEVTITATAPPASPTTQPPGTPEPTAPAGEVAVVATVVDGDTVRLADGRSVRVVGIDTPERGQCGFGPATSNLRRLVEGKEVTLVASAKTDTDRYDRLLRYIDVDGVDAGRDQIAQGLGIARYDSRDGYGAHAREADYVALDEATPDPSCGDADVEPSVHPYPTEPEPVETNSVPQAFAEIPGDYEPVTETPAAAPGAGVYFSSCAQAKAAGAAPLLAGSPGYRPELDRDRDGVACE